MRHLIITLEAPLMAFGGETIDNYGVTRRFPSASMLAGLLCNALGRRRVERELHQRLQDRLVFAARIDREPAGGLPMTDYQTAAITNRDRAWTTRGTPEGRAGGSYANAERWRDYLADTRVNVALRLEPAGESPTLDDLAAALREPARPLFIGRKPCLPSSSLFGGFADGDTVLAALLTAPITGSHDPPRPIRMLWPAGEGVEGVSPNRTYTLTDQRNWISGLHGGGRLVSEGTAGHDRFAAYAGSETRPGKEGG